MGDFLKSMEVKHHVETSLVRKSSQLFVRGLPADTVSAEVEIKKYLAGDDNAGSCTIDLDYSSFINSMIIGEE